MLFVGTDFNTLKFFNNLEIMFEMFNGMLFVISHKIKNIVVQEYHCTELIIFKDKHGVYSVLKS